MMRMAEPYAVRWLRNYITDPTNNQAGSAVFHIFYPNVAPEGVADALAAIEAAHVTYGTGLAAALETNATLRVSFLRAHSALSIPGRELPVGHPHRTALFDALAGLASQYPSAYARQVPFNATTVPTATWVRERLLRTWIDARDLTAAVKQQIADGVQMAGRARDVFLDHGVVLLDNLGLDTAQLDHVHRLLSLLPYAQHRLRAISVRDNLGTPPTAISLDGYGGGVNTVGWAIGASCGNEFPADVPPGPSDCFSVVLAHELAHATDANYLSQSLALQTRKTALITAAGTEQQNYLRSMLDAGFFVQNPQEFFASIANQWFTDSRKTLELGRVRFDAGRHEPINQVLLTAEVYSGGGNATAFFTTDLAGQITRTQVPLHRNAQGRIDTVALDNWCYRFTLDNDGDVTAHQLTPLGCSCFQ